ncbi:ImmA/IrrE family metallo-endopeptidase [Heyndrickxia sporothermodurans]|uniref:ImmA/IrrE family metallo-endopeptidase n=1 Tax=Heyndrickxia sporothermodurans TaxID=46224 RepID=UPI000D350F29|nr:ImmA/IrrE family metallo-endopeptidase [Heyndrickxia sporothermodurans]PTY76209.1 ImmA/IrrE family metallo-endopeptidase [Heyndrickxia sporothermodurans]
MGSILSTIDQLYKKYETNCPFKLAKFLGIHIVYENLGKTLGYFNQFCRIKIIHINENTTEHQRMFICAHELGHAIFHPNANTPFLKKNTLFSTDRIELEANLFAVRLLFSEQFYNDHLNLKDAVELYGIPEKLILNNL